MAGSLEKPWIRKLEARIRRDSKLRAEKYRRLAPRLTAFLPASLRRLFLLPGESSPNNKSTEKIGPTKPKRRELK
jgi:hypothetical protein